MFLPLQRLEPVCPYCAGVLEQSTGWVLLKRVAAEGELALNLLDSVAILVRATDQLATSDQLRSGSRDILKIRSEVARKQLSSRKTQTQ